MHQKKKKKCMHKIKFLLEDKKYIFRKYWAKIKNNHKSRAKNIFRGQKKYSRAKIKNNHNS
jgi:hypothetical protein